VAFNPDLSTASIKKGGTDNLKSCLCCKRQFEKLSLLQAEGAATRRPACWLFIQPARRISEELTGNKSKLVHVTPVVQVHLPRE
jgi:hypothetical protein